MLKGLDNIVVIDADTIHNTVANVIDLQRGKEKKSKHQYIPPAESVNFINHLEFTSEAYLAIKNSLDLYPVEDPQGLVDFCNGLFKKDDFSNYGMQHFPVKRIGLENNLGKPAIINMRSDGLTALTWDAKEAVDFYSFFKTQASSDSVEGIYLGSFIPHDGKINTDVGLVSFIMTPSCYGKLIGYYDQKYLK